jgi:Brp/Blh family beta-carotene 15,15'-monooxygenase
LRVHYQDFMIFFTFLLFWVSIQFGQIIEDSIAYAIVLSIGIIHGSNDFTILKKQQTNTKSFLKSTGFYLFLIIMCIVSYVAIPFASFIFFILLSSYHFGEQHLEGKVLGSKLLKSILYIAYGMLIFSLIFIENLSDVDVIMQNLTGYIIPNEWINIMFIISLSLLVVLFAFLFTRKIKPQIHIVRELFYILLLFLVFKTSSLILGFAIYFVLWHSIPSILDQAKFLSGDYSFKTILEYFKTAFVYWLISILGLVIAYYFLDESLFNSIIFIVLFAVTAPHVWVMNRMKQ